MTIKYFVKEEGKKTRRQEDKKTRRKEEKEEEEWKRNARVDSRFVSSLKSTICLYLVSLLDMTKDVSKIVEDVFEEKVQMTGDVDVCNPLLSHVEIEYAFS